MGQTHSIVNVIIIIIPLFICHWHADNIYLLLNAHGKHIRSQKAALHLRFYQLYSPCTAHLSNGVTLLWSDASWWGWRWCWKLAAMEKPAWWIKNWRLLTHAVRTVGFGLFWEWVVSLSLKMSCPLSISLHLSLMPTISW